MGPLVLIGGGLALAQLAAAALPWQYRGTFEAAAAPYPGVEPELLMALAWKESNFNPAAVGAENANGTRDYGLLQINDANLSRFGLTADTALSDPQANANAAAKLLAELLPRARNRGDLVSMYNAGQAEGGGPRLVTDPNGETHYVDAAYVSDVLARYWYVRVAYFAPIKPGGTNV